MAQRWINQAVFISSTFRDMQTERDYLSKRVFPELEEKLRTEHCHLEPIDLRWGIFTDKNLNTAEKEMKILKVCLDEIDRSRPFIIVLLGDRYGWVPPLERMKQVAEEAGYDHELNERSVTALEIEYGILNTKQPAHRSFFFFRRPLPYERMPAELRPEYSDEFATGGSDDYQRLQALKRHIEQLYEKESKTGVPRIYEYTAGWDENDNRVTSLEEFGVMVSKCIMTAFKAELREKKGQADQGQYAAERELLEQFIESRYNLPDDESVQSRIKSIRQNSINHYTDFLLLPGKHEGKWGICLQGEPGAGKSTIFARLCRELREKDDVLLLVNAAGTTSNSQNHDQVLMRWSEELRLQLGMKPKDAKFGSFEAILQEFTSLLYRAAPGKRVVILIDAINEMNRFDYVKHLTWLPEHWPANARLLATAIPGMECHRRGVESESLGDLKPGEAEDICRNISQRYHKELPPAIIEGILEHKDEAGRSACRNPLWLNLAVDEMITIDADDFKQIATYPGNPEEQIKSFMLDLVKGFEPTIPVMFQKLFERLEEIYGRDWVVAVIGLITAGRNGMREAELTGAYRFIYGVEWDELKFAGLRRYMRMHLVQRGELGQWDFLHRQARISAEQRYLGDQRARQALHGRIADYLEKLPEDNPVRMHELMYHYLNADDKVRAARYYTGELDDACLASASEVMASRVIEPYAGETGSGLEWLKALLELEELDDFQLLTLCRRYSKEIKKRMNAPGSEEEHELIDMIFSKSLSLYGKNSGNADFKHEFAMSLEAVSGFQQARLNYEAANSSMLNEMFILIQLKEQYPGTVEYQLDLVRVYHHLGMIIQQWQGELRAVEAYCQSAMEILENINRHSVSEDDYQIRLRECYSLFAFTNISRGNTDKAEEYQNRIIEMHMADAADDSSAGVQNGLATAFMQMGDIKKMGQKMDEAEGRYHQAIEVFERLILLEPDAHNHRWGIAHAYRRRGETLLALGRLEEAEASCRKGLETRKLLAELFPDDLLFKSDSLNYYQSLGVVYLNQSRLDEARAVFEERLEANENLIRQSPDSIHFRRDLAINHRTLAEICHAQKDVQSAVSHYASGIEIMKEIASRKEEPDSPEKELKTMALKHPFNFRRIEEDECSKNDDMILWSHLCKGLGELYLEQHQLEAALDTSGRNIEILQLLAAQDSEETIYRGPMADECYQAGEIAEKLCHWDAAAQYYALNLESLEFLAQQASGRAPYLKNLAFVSQKTGDMQLANGNSAAAADYYRKSQSLLLEIGIKTGTNTAYDEAVREIKSKVEKVEGRINYQSKPQAPVRNRKSDSKEEVEEYFQTQAEAEAKKQKEANERLIEQARKEVNHKKTRQTSAKEEADRNIRYQKALAEWKALSWFKKMRSPEPKPEDF